MRIYANNRAPMLLKKNKHGFHNVSNLNLIQFHRSSKPSMVNPKTANTLYKKPAFIYGLACRVCRNKPTLSYLSRWHISRPRASHRHKKGAVMTHGSFWWIRSDNYSGRRGIKAFSFQILYSSRKPCRSP